jgi:hypothetical protein
MEDTIAMENSSCAASLADAARLVQLVKIDGYCAIQEMQHPR